MARNPLGSLGRMSKRSLKAFRRKNDRAPVCTETDPPLPGGSGGVWDVVDTAHTAVLHPPSLPDHKALSSHMLSVYKLLPVNSDQPSPWKGIMQGCSMTVFPHLHSVKPQETIRSVRAPPLQCPFNASFYFLCQCVKTQSIPQWHFPISLTDQVGGKKVTDTNKGNM